MAVVIVMLVGVHRSTRSMLGMVHMTSGGGQRSIAATAQPTLRSFFSRRFRQQGPQIAAP